MFKSEIYKLFHTKSVYYLFCLVIVLSIYLSNIILKMNVTNIEEGLSIIFASTSSVIMLYFMIFSSIFINRDYNVNYYRILIGTGIDRKRIILFKYIIFIIFGLLILFTHSFVSIFILQFHFHQFQHEEIFIKILLYYFPYVSILSITFFLSIIGHTMIKSLLFNLSQIISFGVMGQIANSNRIPIIPLHMLMVISNGNTSYNTYIILFSTLYIIIFYIFSFEIFIKQEL